jgi:hypothetical protein
MKLFAPLTLAACLVASCATAPIPGTPGMVYDDEGRPLSGVDVGTRGQVLARSDVNGRFLLGPLPATPKEATRGRILEFHRDGYEPGTIDLDATTEALPGSVVYLKMASRDQLLKQTWAALDRADFAEAAQLLERARVLGRDDSFWALTKATLLLLDPASPPGALAAFLPDLQAGKYGPLDPGWQAWWDQRLTALRSPGPN